MFNGLMQLADGTPVDAVVVTESMLQPIITSITGNLNVLLVAGISILAVMVGVALIPRIIWRFF